MIDKKINEFDNLNNNLSNNIDNEFNVNFQEEIEEPIISTIAKKKQPAFLHPDKNNRRYNDIRNANPRPSPRDGLIEDMGATMMVTDSSDVIGITYNLIKDVFKKEGKELSVAFFLDTDESISIKEREGWELLPASSIDSKRKTSIRSNNSSHDGLKVGYDLVAMVRDKRINDLHDYKADRQYIENTKKLFTKTAYRTPYGPQMVIYDDEEAYRKPFDPKSGPDIVY